MAWTQEEIDDEMLSHTDFECWECQGEGVYHDECECEAFEDFCACAEPTPRRCNSCSGTGRQDDAYKGRTMPDEITITKRRIEACAAQAHMNARNHGGDAATAAADIMCAFVLLSVKSGADPEKAKAAMWDHAKVVVANFWPAETLN